MIYNLYCTNHRDYTYHSVLDDKEEKTQTITCLFCGHKQERVIVGRRVSVSKPLYEAYQEQQKHAE